MSYILGIIFTLAAAYVVGVDVKKKPRKRWHR